MTEADNLRRLFDGINRKEFAKTHKLPGGASMVYQHLTGRRPISLIAASAYAKAFGVPLSTISERLANLAGETAQPGNVLQGCSAEYIGARAANVKPLIQPEDPDIAEVVRMMRETDSRGRAMALAAVRVALNGHENSVKNAAQ